MLADEFANSLDRVTAKIVSRNLRRALTGSRIAAILATAHEDLEPALAPDSTIHCDFGTWQSLRPQKRESASNSNGNSDSDSDSNSNSNSNGNCNRNSNSNSERGT